MIIVFLPDVSQMTTLTFTGLGRQHGEGHVWASRRKHPPENFTDRKGLGNTLEMNGSEAGGGVEARPERMKHWRKAHKKTQGSCMTDHNVGEESSQMYFHGLLTRVQNVVVTKHQHIQGTCH